MSFLLQNIFFIGLAQYLNRSSFQLKRLFIVWCIDKFTSYLNCRACQHSLYFVMVFKISMINNLNILEICSII